MAVIGKANDAGPITITESLVQRELYHWLQGSGHDLIVPNTSMAFCWESDLVSVTSAGYLCDYEIKVSRADWLRELRTASAEHRDQSSRDWTKWMRHQRLSDLSSYDAVNFRGDVHIPSRFWVVAPEGVVADGELPAYAGLLLVTPKRDRLLIEKHRKAPMLHRHKASTRDVRTLAKGLMLRLWDQRHDNSGQVA